MKAGRSIAVAAVAIAIALAVSLAWRATSEARRELDSVAPPPRDAVAAATPESLEARPEPADIATPVAVELSRVDVAPSPGARVVLVVSDESEVNVRPLEVRVLVERGSVEELASPGSSYRGSIGDDGSCRIDVTRLFRDVASWPRAMAVEMDRAGLSAQRFDVLLTVDGAPLVPELIRHRSEVELCAVVALSNVAIVKACVQSGGVRRSSIRVRLIDEREYGSSSGLSLSRVELAEDGPFEFVCEAGREYALTAEANGLRTAARYLGVVEAGVRDVGDLLLGEGLAIRGRIGVGGKFTSIEAIPIPNRDERRPTERLLERIVEAVERWGGQSAPVSSDGSFEITGLGSSTYSLEPCPRFDVSGVQVAGVAVRAPADGVVLTDALVAVHLELRVDGEALKRAEVYAGAVEENWLAPYRRGLTDDQGRLTLWFPPSAPIYLEMLHHKFAVEAGTESDAAWRVIDL